MATFSKKHSISSIDSSYQIVAKGEIEGRQAVITKFANERNWSVALMRDNEISTDYVHTDVEYLSSAKNIASSWVEC